jgi:potassium-transporting ATPase KdpC subunit
MLQQLVPAIRATILITLATGLLYPAVVTGVCQLLFKSQAGGSLITRNGQVIGSKLIGQNFTKPEYFHPRPSNAGTDGYDASSSGGYNWGPTNQKLADRVRSAASQFRKENPDYNGPIPADALTGSASGLDPEISFANARIQAARVARARALSPEAINKLIAAATRGRDLGFLGEPRVNVLALNLSLDHTPFQANSR